MSSDDERGRDERRDDARPSGAWRDERRLSLSELTAAVASSATDGQVDDVSGNDAGIEETLDTEPAVEPEPDPDSLDGRRLRSGFTGPTGPH